MARGRNKLSKWVAQYSLLTFFVVAFIALVLFWVIAFLHPLDSGFNQAIRWAYVTQSLGVFIGLFAALHSQIRMPSGVEVPSYYKAMNRHNVFQGLLILAVILFIFGMFFQVISLYK